MVTREGGGSASSGSTGSSCPCVSTAAGFMGSGGGSSPGPGPPEVHPAKARLTTAARRAEWLKLRIKRLSAFYRTALINSAILSMTGVTSSAFADSSENTTRSTPASRYCFKRFASISAPNTDTGSEAASRPASAAI